MSLCSKVRVQEGCQFAIGLSFVGSMEHWREAGDFIESAGD